MIYNEIRAGLFRLNAWSNGINMRCPYGRMIGLTVDEAINLRDGLDDAIKSIRSAKSDGKIIAPTAYD